MCCFQELKVKAVLSFTLSYFMCLPISSEQLFFPLLFSSTFFFLFLAIWTCPIFEPPGVWCLLWYFAVKCCVVFLRLIFSFILFFLCCTMMGWGGCALDSWNRQLVELWEGVGFTLWNLNNTVKKYFSSVCTASANLYWKSLKSFHLGYVLTAIDMQARNPVVFTSSRLIQMKSICKLR